MLDQTEIKAMVDQLQGNSASVQVLADHLGYQVGKNPMDDHSQWQMLFTDKVNSRDHAVMAVLPKPELDEETPTVKIRKLFQEVLDLQNNTSPLFGIEIVAFVGVHRVVFFPYNDGNRDTRLDINQATSGMELYIQNINALTNDSIQIGENEFGLGVDINIDTKQAFRKQLDSFFRDVVSLYRKKLSEVITGSTVKQELKPLLTAEAQHAIENDDLNTLVQSDSYTSVLSVVVDTIVLRQLMRRFLEAYYGSKSFNVNGIALGVGDGTMDQAVANAVNVASHLGTQKSIQKLNRQANRIQQLDLFDNAFTKDEMKATSEVTVDQQQRKLLNEIEQKARQQFQLAYGGDLFAGSVAAVTNRVSAKLSNDFPEVISKFWTDTNAGNFSFRYQDLPPEGLEKQYEDSMSKNVQIKLDDQQKPIVFYGDDKTQQKNKGAYYTDDRFVNYMVNQTVTKEFDQRFQVIQNALKAKDESAADKALQHLLDLKIADFTAGGGSFLRGAFLKLAEQYQMLHHLPLTDHLAQKYPMFTVDDDGFQWENYILHHMIYGVDIDYKALIIASLTLTLSSLKHRPGDHQLPQLIGRTLIHQNALINAVPYYRREAVFGPMQKDIARLRKLKQTDFANFNRLRQKLQDQVIPQAGEVAQDAGLLHIESLELNLPEIFFNADGTLKPHGGLDIVIGNPPWDVWKPNSDEFFGPLDAGYLKLGKKKKEARQNELMVKLPTLKHRWDNEVERIRRGSNYYRSSDAFHYQTWKVNGQKTSSDLNLYKISLERFIQLGSDKARFAILMPDNLMTDSGSTGLRHLLFDHYHVNEFLSFDNNKGIFSAVHRSYKFAVTIFDHTATHTEKFKAFFYQRNLNALQEEDKKVTYHLSDIRNYEPEKLSLMEVGSQSELDIYKKLRQSYQPLGQSELLTFTNDFHKTNNAKLFVDNDGQNIPLFEGKDIYPFIITKRYSKLSDLPDAIAPDVAEKRVGNNLKVYRIVIRSIARATDQRSLIAGLLPPHTTFVNSLTGQKNSTEMPLEEKLFILGMLDSYTMDYVLRHLITSNVNQIYLKQLPVPRMNDVNDANQIIQITKELLKENRNYYHDLDELVPGDDYHDLSHLDLVAELNARVAIDFHLSREEIITVMDTFKSPKHIQNVEQTTQAILNAYYRLTRRGED